MALFKIEQNKAQKIKSIEAGREKDVQTIFENNLETILDVYFLATEYPEYSDIRIDTLGIARDGSPVIIEYKKTKNESIINQGIAYLRWLLEHKDGFEKLVSEKLAKPLGCPINWDNPRIICVAESYNKFDLPAADFIPIKIELLTYTIYENDTLEVELQNIQKARIAVAGILRNAKRETVVVGEDKLQKNYTIEEHLNVASENIKILFSKLREQIKSIDENIKEEPQKYYIAYKLTTNFTDIEIHKNHLKVFLNIESGQLNDPYSITRDMKNPVLVGHLGNGDYEVKISKEEELNKLFDLIKQSYNYNK